MLLALVLWPHDAVANHSKGLPHYGYFDNYPQVPTEEYVAVDGKWEMGVVLFNFQGYDRRTSNTPNDVKIYLYLYDADAGANYTGPIDVEIRRNAEIVSSFRRVTVDEESVYATRETLPSSGDYQLAVRPKGEREIVLPFHVELASGGIPWRWITGLGLPAIAVLSLAIFGRTRRFRPRRPVRGRREAAVSG